jgi:hypothetical protein
MICPIRAGNLRYLNCRHTLTEQKLQAQRRVYDQLLPRVYKLYKRRLRRQVHRSLYGALLKEPIRYPSCLIPWLARFLPRVYPAHDSPAHEIHA